MKGFHDRVDDLSINQLHANIRSYASKQLVNSSTQTSEIGNSEVKIVDATRRGMLLYWRGTSFKNRSHVEMEVLDYVKKGGAFVVAVCPNRYRKCHGNIPLTHVPFYGLLNAAGLEYTDDIVPDSAEVHVARPHGL